MKKRFIFFILISTFLVLAACGSGNNANEDDSALENEDDTVMENENDEDTNMVGDNEENTNDEQDDQSEDTSENDLEDDDGDLITETGIYNGQADPHTIEIETEDGPQAFQLTMEARDDIEHLTVGGEVTYSYYVDGEQLVIEEIQPTE